jgi:peptide/nickel transport system substrate-binding protein
MWEDIASQINATNGKNKDFPIAATNGADRVEKVTRGVDDRQAVVTFAKPFSEWTGMFAGQHDAAAQEHDRRPEVFNKGQLDRPGPSAGPFMITKLDRTAQRITLSRNPKWWGTTPLLDTHHVSGARRQSARFPRCRTTPSTPPGSVRCPK